MACCGQKRHAMSNAGIATQASPSSSSSPVTIAGAARPGDVRLRYGGRGGFSMRSMRTGRLYACGTTGAILTVDPSDAQSLIRTRLFTPA